MRYPGGKNAPGVYQHIINRMPPHDTYIELFGGSLAIYRHKRRSHNSILIEADPTVFLQTWHRPPGSPAILSIANATSCQPLNTDAISYVRKHHHKWRESTLVYADPPYLIDTRQSRQRMYNLELTTPQHTALLHYLSATRANVMISGYHNALYDEALQTWFATRYKTMTRGGYPVTETLWCNFPPPATLHDTQYIGQTFRERERIKRLCDRWHRRFKRFDQHIQQRILEQINTT